jgi:sugar transferase (PEP-CTERM system associated)
MFKISNHYVSKVVFALLLFEIAILFGAGYMGVNIRLLSEHNWPNNFQKFFPASCAFTLAITIGMSALGLYQCNLNENLRATFLRLMPSFAIALVVLLLVFYIAPELYLGRGILLLAFLIAGIGILAARVLFFKLTESRMLVSKIIFLGASELVRDCVEAARNNIRNHKYDIVGAIPVVGEESCMFKEGLINAADSLLAATGRYRAREIVVAVQNRRGGNLRIQELLECKLKGIHVIDATAFFEREACQIRLDCLQPSWLVFGNGFDQSIIRTFIKRSFDLLISAVLLPLLAPVMLGAMLCIYLEDRSPVFYRQERVGMNGKTFMVLKFRSMKNNAEKAGQPQWATSNDPRVTRVGAIMRKFRIDELPQLINVFKGEMSFVGPRPERPFFVDQFSKEILFYNVRHSVKPGITGWAQVQYRYGASKEDAIQKLQYDLYYVKNNSLFLDILILIDTLSVVLFGAGT